MLPNTVTVNSGPIRLRHDRLGKITGAASITKTGNGTLLLGTTNDFTGTVSVQGSTLQVANNSSLGSTKMPERSSPAERPLILAAMPRRTPEPGPGTSHGFRRGLRRDRALINSGAVAQQNAVRLVTLARRHHLWRPRVVAWRGQCRWPLGHSRRGRNLGHRRPNYNLTKTGTNQISLVGAIVDPALGNVDIQQGMLRIQQGTTSLGQFRQQPLCPRGREPGVFSRGLPVEQTNCHLWRRRDHEPAEAGNAVFPSNVISGPITLSGQCVVGGGATAATSLTFSNSIGGTGGLTVNGAASFTAFLTAPINYTGNTIINGGTLALAGTSSLASSPQIRINGATLNVTGRGDGTLTVATGKQLIVTGAGIINGGLTVPSGATLTTGTATDSLTVSNAVVLQGNTFLTIDKFNNATNLVRAGVSIAYGGVLNLNVNSSILAGLADGDSFKLFNAPAYSGAFSSIVTSPALPAGLYVDASRRPGGQWNAENHLHPAALAAAHRGNAPYGGGQLGIEWCQWNGERRIYSSDFHQRRAAAEQLDDQRRQFL